MKDIKLLYENAIKYGSIHSGNNSALNEYVEAVNYMLESAPYEYLSNLEYIISSSYGIGTFEKFIETHKLPLSQIPYIENKIEKAKKKFKAKHPTEKNDPMGYGHMVEVLESYKETYSNCYDMAVYFMEKLDDRYTEAYYKNFPMLKKENVNIVALMSRYQEACIPDLLVYTEAAKHILESIYDNQVDKHNVLQKNQWIKDSLKDFSNVDNEILDVFTKESLEESVNTCIDNNEKLFRENAISGIEHNDIFTEQDIKNIEELILYKEYKLCGRSDRDERRAILEQVNSLYTTLSPILEDFADSVAPMLPGTRATKPIIRKQYTIEAITSNTSNKKSGKSPGYLRDNHDLTYGEDDERDGSNKSSDDGEVGDDILGKTDDASSKDKKDDPMDGVDPYDYELDDDNKNDKSIDKVNNTNSDKPSSGSTYYYYNYNYTNSNNNSNKSHYDYSQHNKSVKDSYNKRSQVTNNTNSFNKDSHDNNSQYDRTKLYGQKHTEAVGDADDNKPESDSPIRDTMMEIDRKVSEGLNTAKKGAGKVAQAARAVSRPFKRAYNFVNNAVEKWKDANENEIKEELADPHKSSSIMKAFKTAVKYGSIAKAGLLLNPIFLGLMVLKKMNTPDKDRIRNEMIGELKTELQVISEKIKDADNNGDRKEKYQMMRLKNELTKKLIRVGGTGDMKDMI